MLSFEERIAWILNKIKEREKINNIQLAKILGVDKNTAQAYCHGKGTIKGSALSAIVINFGISGEWLMSGSGEPFTGARDKFPDICGTPSVTKEQIDKITDSVKYQMKSAALNYDSTIYDHAINIDEAMGKAYKVLNAGTALSVALYMNIQQFAAALDTGQELKECKDLIKAMQAQIDALNHKVDRLSAPSIAERQADGSEKQAI